MTGFRALAWVGGRSFGEGALPSVIQSQRLG